MYFFPTVLVYQSINSKKRSFAGTLWSGCYFHLPSPVPDEIYVVTMSPLPYSRFTAYVFASRNVTSNNVICFQLGVPDFQLASVVSTTYMTNILNLSNNSCNNKSLVSFNELYWF